MMDETAAPAPPPAGLLSVLTALVTAVRSAANGEVCGHAYGTNSKLGRHLGTKFVLC